MHTAHAPLCYPAGALTALEVYTSMGPLSPMEEVIFISTRHVKLLNFEFRARNQTLTT